MENKPENETQVDKPFPQYVSSKPPIFYFYKFLQQQPIFLGTLTGALVGLITAARAELQVNLAVIGGAVIGTVVAAIVLRLRA